MHCLSVSACLCECLCGGSERESWTAYLPLSLPLCPFFVLCHTFHTFPLYFSFLSSLFIPSLYIFTTPCLPWPCLPSFPRSHSFFIHPSLILHIHSTWSPTLQGSQLSHCELCSFATLLFSLQLRPGPHFSLHSTSIHKHQAIENSRPFIT